MTTHKVDVGRPLTDILVNWGIEAEPDYVEGLTAPDGLERAKVAFFASPQNFQLIIRYKWSSKERRYFLDGGFQKRCLRDTRAHRELPDVVWEQMAKRALARGWRPLQSPAFA
jgi:hypothetical protein